jgi:nitroimidazol reductase NimA-like FMN-containing flavoprotein (pyridoxamine 5'-phosphate oxidase superfamily)
MEQTIDVPEGVRVLDADGCWRLLAAHDIGRFAVRIDDRIDLFPINYLVHDRAVYFRSAPGSKLVDLGHSPEVTFEIDGQSAHHVWSVVIHGVASMLLTDAEVDESGLRALRTWYPSDKFNYVRITPTTVTGRDFFKS